MKTIADSIDSILQNHPLIEEALIKGIVNYSALAKRLNVRVNEYLKRDVKPEAIMMALRRHKLPSSIEQADSLRGALSYLGPITVRSNLANFSYKNSVTLLKSNTKLLNIIENDPNIFYGFTRELHESNLTISNAKSDLVSTLFKDEALLRSKKGLSAISIQFPEETTKVAGLYYTIFKRLAWYNIPTYEVISSMFTLTILFEDEYVNQAFIALKELSS